MRETPHFTIAGGTFVSGNDKFTHNLGLTDTIKSIIDADSFNHELEEELKEKAELERYRKNVLKLLSNDEAETK